MNKIVIPYDHDPASFETISLALVPTGQTPRSDAWVPALRDTVNGRRVVWARFPPAAGDVWLRDRSGARKLGPRE